jgi:hypothetical protein
MRPKNNLYASINDFKSVRMPNDITNKTKLTGLRKMLAYQSRFYLNLIRHMDASRLKKSIKDKCAVPVARRRVSGFVLNKEKKIKLKEDVFEQSRVINSLSSLS